MLAHAAVACNESNDETELFPQNLVAKPGIDNIDVKLQPQLK